MKFGPAYVLGATVGNHSGIRFWDIVKVYASMGRNVASGNVCCCVKYDNEFSSEYYKQPILFSNHQSPKTELTAYHFTCKNPKPGSVPEGIGLTVDNFTCDEEYVTYIKPLVPLLETGTKLALSTKVAYGNQDPELIIEWMETYKYLGVDKVITYFLDDLKMEARKVLGYYASSGILELYNIQLAATGMYKTNFLLFFVILFYYFFFFFCFRFFFFFFFFFVFFLFNFSLLFIATIFFQIFLIPQRLSVTACVQIVTSCFDLNDNFVILLLHHRQVELLYSNKCYTIIYMVLAGLVVR